MRGLSVISVETEITEGNGLRHLAAALGVVLLLLGAGGVRAESTLSGRLETAGSDQVCGATLIAPGMVVTAGHCMGEGSVRRPFRTGSGPGTYLVIRGHRHPGYGTEEHPILRYRTDLALGLLAEPVPQDVQRPLPIGPPARKGERLLVETWRRDEGDVPRVRECLVEDKSPGQVLLACAVASGHSGAPVIRMTPDGPEIVAVVNARFGGPLGSALGADLLPRIDALRAGMPED
jgi:hypothetical protein